MMKVISAFLVAALSGSVWAQNPIAPDADGNAYDSSEWHRVPFDERLRQFLAEERDSEWAISMEQAIRDKVSEFDRPLAEVFSAEVCTLVTMCQVEMPSVQAALVECRTTLCRIEMRWPSGATNPIIGQQLSFLYGIGIDHQGEIRAGDNGTRFRVEMIARRRT